MEKFEVGKSYLWSDIEETTDCDCFEYGTGTLGKQAYHLTDGLDKDIWFIFDSYNSNLGGYFKCVYIS